MSLQIRPLRVEDLREVVALQRLAFPPPFDEDLLWSGDHLLSHLEKFSEGQFVAELNGQIVGSCANTRVEESRWNEHLNWDATVGGPFLEHFSPTGSTLYGLDITVHPEFRRLGIGRAFYKQRFGLIHQLGMVRYGTGCRLPDYRSFEASHPGATPEQYAQLVVEGQAQDRTLTPLLRYNLTFLGVIRNYMSDFESADCAALLEWKP